MRAELAPFASDATKSRGRLYPEAESSMRSCFQRDRDRIVHSTAFRRLMHKTQVFVSPGGDHFRTRLTHSLEVAQIARAIARNLGLDEDLTEALALAHDFGHTPFGHAGEEALDAVMRPYGGFDHNDQSLRILTRLERRYAAFDGLNLTWETLEGIVKHNGPCAGPLAGNATPTATVAAYNARHDLELDTFAGPEAQVAALADDIAYDNHDVDDGLRAGLFEIEQLEAVPHAAAAFAAAREANPGIARSRLIHEAVRRLIDAMVRDALAETRRRLAAAGPRSAAEVRGLDHPVVAFSGGMVQKDRAIKNFLFANMYRHPTAIRETDAARRIVPALFGYYMETPSALPEEWRRQTDGESSPAIARVIADFIAGMTDRYATREHARVFGTASGAA
jgi:dGTPase